MTSSDLVRSRALARDVVVPRLARISGVAAVDVFGGHIPAVTVTLDAMTPRRYGIRFSQVVRELREGNVSRSAGLLRTERTSTTYRVEMRTNDLVGLRALPISVPGTPGMPKTRVRLKELSRIEHGHLQNDALYSVGGRDAIAIQVMKTTKANTVEVVSAVQQTLEELKRMRPDQEFIVGEESATFTKVSIGNLFSNIRSALFFAGVLIFLFLGRWKIATVAIVSMPLSYGLTFALMKLFDVELNMVTLTAVILAVGMVVDATVVMLENIVRVRDETGLSPEKAAIEGLCTDPRSVGVFSRGSIQRQTQEVPRRKSLIEAISSRFRPIMMTSISTVVGMIPLAAEWALGAERFSPLATAVMGGLTASTLLTLVFIPVLTDIVDSWRTPKPPKIL